MLQTAAETAERLAYVLPVALSFFVGLCKASGCTHLDATRTNLVEFFFCHRKRVPP